MGRTAAILGGTGLVGQHLLDHLLESANYDEVLSFSRKSLGRQHPKLTQKTGDLLSDDFFGDAIVADDIFCAIGTTQSKTPDLTTYRNIDYGIPVRAATLGLKGGMRRFLVVSSMGANSASKMFYPKVKGQMEEALEAMQIPHLRILRPSIIAGKRSEFRLGESAAHLGMKLLDPLLPQKYRRIHAKKIAKAMMLLAQMDDNAEVYWESDRIRELGGK